MNEAACSESERLVTSIPAMIRMIWITATMIIKARLYRPACVVIFSLRVNQMMTNIKRVCTRISDRNIRELIYPKGVLKMTYSRNRYDQDFKKNAVRLSFNSSKPVRIIASELGVPESALYRWRKLYTEDGKQTPFASLEAENRALKRENAELALERDMLKKAAAYFASLQK